MMKIAVAFEAEMDAQNACDLEAYIEFGKAYADQNKAN
jgi:hypothetical protein